MYVARIVYPSSESGRFDLDHYRTVHGPLGLRLLRKHVGVEPHRWDLDTNARSPFPDAPPAYQCASSLYFRTEQEADRFMDLFGVAEAAEELTADLSKFTDVQPQITVCAVEEIDPATIP
jgi:EthD domain